MPQNGDCVAAAVAKRVGESLNADVCGKGGNAGGTHGIYCALDQQFSYCIKGNAEGKFLVGTFIKKQGEVVLPPVSFCRYYLFRALFINRPIRCSGPHAAAG